MNKNRFQLLVIAALLISNVLLIIFINLPKKHNGFHPNKPRNIIIERLHFDEKQIEAYDKLIEQHRKQIRENDKQIILMKNELYLNLRRETDDKILDSLTTSIAKIQKQIETTHYLHFVDIRNICKKEQLNNYNELILELSKIFSPKQHPPKHK